MPNTPRALFRGYPLHGSTPVRTFVNNRALTSNLVTLTTSANHGITQVGTLVTVLGVDSTFDGSYTVHSIPAANTFTYVRTAGNVTSGAVSPVGLATFAGGATATVGFTVTNRVVQNNVATLTTSSAHGMAVGNLVQVTLGDSVYDTLAARIVAVPTTTTLSYVVSTATAASTATSQGSVGRLPVLYTVPASTTTVLTNVTVTNETAAAQTFTVIAAGASIALATPIAANSVAVFNLRQVLSTGDTVAAVTSSPMVSMVVNGMEIT